MLFHHCHYSHSFSTHRKKTNEIQYNQTEELQISGADRVRNWRKSITTARETTEKYKYPSFTTETAFEIQVLDATETVEQNTSKQISAKETALRNVYKYSRINFFFFFLKRNEYGGTESRKWIERISGL